MSKKYFSYRKYMSTEYRFKSGILHKLRGHTHELTIYPIRVVWGISGPFIYLFNDRTFFYHLTYKYYFKRKEEFQNSWTLRYTIWKYITTGYDFRYISSLRDKGFFIKNSRIPKIENVRNHIKKNLL